MSYQGYLIKVGGYPIDTERFIQAKSYSVTRNIQDLDSYRDANGVLHRTALDHVPIKVEFDTRNMLTNVEMAELFSNIRSNFSVTKERKASVTLYVPELDDYITQDMYTPDPKIQIYGIFDDVIKYNSTRIAFIGY